MPEASKEAVHSKDMTETERSVKNIFEHMCEKHGDMAISVEDLKQIIMSGENLSDDDIQVMFDAVDKDSVRHAMTNLADGSDSAFLHAVFGGWREHWQDVKTTERQRAHMVKADRETGDLVSYHKQLHKQNVMQAMEKLAANSDGGLMHVIFDGWHQEMLDARTSELQRHHREPTNAKHDHVLEKALLKWAEGDAQLLLHAVVNTWYQDIADEKQWLERDLQLAHDQALKRKHDAHMEADGHAEQG